MNAAWALVPEPIRRQVVEAFAAGPVVMDRYGAAVYEDEVLCCPFGLAFRAMEVPVEEGDGSRLFPTSWNVMEVLDGDAYTHVAADEFIETYSEPLRQPEPDHAAFVAGLAEALGVER